MSNVNKVEILINDEDVSTILDNRQGIDSVDNAVLDQLLTFAEENRDERDFAVELEIDISEHKEYDLNVFEDYSGIFEYVLSLVSEN